MIEPNVFVQYLVALGFRHFTGVPCSYFKDVLSLIEDQDDLMYGRAPNEGSALAFASGLCLGGRRAAVMIQNSGLGNLMNPLTSLNSVYGIPVPIFVSGRAYGIADEPQHEIMGHKMAQLLDSIGISFWDLPQQESSMKEVVALGIKEMDEQKKPVIFFIRKGTFSTYDGRRGLEQAPYPLKRIDAIGQIRSRLHDEDFVFVTTGKASREFFSLNDRPRNFYMQGSMGHIGSLALGTAVAEPHRRMIVIDGDGAFLMHMGAVSMIGYYRPKNFFHILLDNEAHESTGGQRTTASATNFTMIVQACGYRFSEKVTNEQELQQVLRTFFQQEGPAFLHIKLNCLPTENAPRITTRYTAPQITENFMRSLERSINRG